MRRGPFVVSPSNHERRTVSNQRFVPFTLRQAQGERHLFRAPGDHDKKALRKTKAAYCFVATTRPSAFRNTR